MSILKDTEKKMIASIDHLIEELKGIRTGQANPHMLDSVTVEVYGTQMKIRDLATITSPEPRQLLITPFDKQNNGVIGKAIEKANLGFMPTVDGNVVRIIIPPMDDSMRQEMVKQCHKRREECKVSIRTERRQGNDLARRQKGEGELSEDELKRIEKEIQELTDKYCKQADEIVEKKEKEVATI